MTTLILGFGNPDRQDDGVAWHILATLLQAYGHPHPNSIDIDERDLKNNLHFLFQFQLLPELASDLNQYDHAVFIDAHTGAIPSEVQAIEVAPDFQSSPLTHHLTANSLLAITKNMHGRYPSSILVSIRGYEFGFSQELSQRTQNLVPVALEKIQSYLAIIKE
jgi:hydrogenase maturation protease